MFKVYRVVRKMVARLSPDLKVIRIYPAPAYPKSVVRCHIKLSY